MAMQVAKIYKNERKRSSNVEHLGVARKEVGAGGNAGGGLNFVACEHPHANSGVMRP